MVVQWASMLPHSCRVSGSILSMGYCVEFCMFSPYLHGFSLGSLVSSHILNMAIGVLATLNCP